MLIHGMNKTTLLDYPKHLAALLFLGGCNMRCPFCQNASLVMNPASQPVIPEEEVFAYLNKRINILEGVCISGGEPTLYPELPEFILRIKSLGYKVKLDTNGTNPSMLKSLAQEHLVDYIAMDIKNSREKYGLTSGICDSKTISITDSLTTGIDNPLLPLVEESVAYLLTEPIDYEFRTTIVKELHTREDILVIGQWLAGAKAYYLQSYRDSGDILCPGYSAAKKEVLEEYVTLLTPTIKQVSIRGLDE